MSTVTNIVITGGPCAGKSTGMSVIEQELTQKGYKVFVIPETATEVITAGVKVPDYDTLDFQGSIFALQSKKVS